MRRNQRGQSLLEFAIVVPILLLLLFGIIDFSRLLFSYVSLVNGARDLSRMAAISARTTQAGSDGIAAFDALTKIGGTTTPAATVSLSPGGSCTSVTAAGCTFKLSSTSPSTSMSYSAGAHASGSGTVTFPGGTHSFAPSMLGMTGDGDFVAMTWVDGTATTGFVQICPLGSAPPLQTSCTPAGSFGSLGNGFVQVDVNYTFRFNPLFQNRLASVVDVSFMRQTSQLSTSARTYIE